MIDDITYALMAGGSYLSNRPDKNKFPIPIGWGGFEHRTLDSGFEAVSFQKGYEIVISFAGTNPKDLWGDIPADSWDLLVGGRRGRKNPLTLCVAIG